MSLDNSTSTFGLDAANAEESKMGASGESKMPNLNNMGSGAEQDRHASHFGLGADGLARAQQLAGTKGVGAEQDRYGDHFSAGAEKMGTAMSGAMSGAFQGTSGAEQDRHEGHFGLGADGLAKVQKLAETKGTGAEQDRYGDHFSGALDAAKDKIASMQK